jgi:hypothetical protein
MTDTPDLDQIDMAVSIIRAGFQVGCEVMIERETDPSVYPIYGETPTTTAIARRIVGALLRQGWTPPGGITVPDIEALVP